MRAPLETKTLATAYPLNVGLNQISKLFPIGEVWERIRLTFAHTVVIGTGAGAKALGEYGIIKGINFKTDKNEVAVDNVPGIGLYSVAYRQDRVQPYHVAVAAASATYYATIDLPFGLSWLKRPEDFFINSRRYKSVELSIVLGTIADLFTAPGTATVTSVVAISLVRSVANVWAPDRRSMNLSLPHKIPYIKHMPVLDPSAQNYWDIESSPDLYITDIIASMGVSATAGVPYSGTPADGLDGITFVDNLHTYIDHAPVSHFQQLRRKFLGADLPGAYFYSFIPGGSYREAYKTKDKSDLKLQWDSAAGAAPLQADLILIGYRNPKAT